MKNGDLKVRTYERGVEDETLSCGTGVTAASLAVATSGMVGKKDKIKIVVPGGNLSVKFKETNHNSFTDVWLEGPAIFVYKGEIEI